MSETRDDGSILMNHEGVVRSVDAPGFVSDVKNVLLFLLTNKST
jgi:hypothetical protein